MTRQLFLRTDPVELDRYELKSVPRRLKFSTEKIHHMDLLKRAIQSLPPRELQMLYTDHVLGVGQEEASSLFCVRQSNLSYRVQRANKRITLYAGLNRIISETSLRRSLLRLGMTEDRVRIVLGVAKTTSQSATAEAFKISQGSVRYIFASALKKVEASLNGTPVHQLLLEVEQNYNQLRAIQPQKRWQWKVLETNYALDDGGETDDTSNWDDLCSCL